ncbi:MAG: nucleotide sugar dehydrogenase [Nevskia sp.]|nr:nucleotide sugar dehydrogenase [Nevskia sp.]
MIVLETAKVGVVGLGYVGLPLAVEFARKFDTLGFDIDPQRVADLQAGRDHTHEVRPEDLLGEQRLRVSCRAQDLASRDVFVVTVPTPVDAFKQPDFAPLIGASEIVAAHMQRRAIVVYESTVYPGATEEVCVPVLERGSGLRFNRDFFVGYSPERINPGDQNHRLTGIRKITSGSTPEAADFVDALYASIIRAGTHKASSIRVAEAAKVIENIQRDVNIALINELAVIFNRLGLETAEVLDAAATKWNFLPFRPGLVGGHCIGVDPYYLTQKAQAIGYHPEIILAGRRINDSMGGYVAQQTVRLMTQRGISLVGGRALVMGLTFKENCPDIRNTKVVDVIAGLRDFGLAVDVYDPLVPAAQAQREYGLALVAEPAAACYDAIVLAVAHRQFGELGIERIRAFGKPGSVVYDVKCLFSAAATDGRL